MTQQIYNKIRDIYEQQLEDTTIENMQIILDDCIIEHDKLYDQYKSIDTSKSIEELEEAMLIKYNIDRITILMSIANRYILENIDN